MNIIFYSVDSRKEEFRVESPSLDSAYEHVEEHFADMAEYEGDGDLNGVYVVNKKPKVWIIKNFGTGGTYLLYIKNK